MSDYSFLKTGFNTLIEPDKPDENLILNVQSILFSFMENAVKRSEVYIEHGGRHSITKEDIKLCLMVETFEYLQRADLLESIEKWKQIIKEDDDDDNLDDDLDDDLEDDLCEYDGELEPEYEDEPFKNNNCKCKECIKMNNIELLWPQWSPKEGIETILKNAIEKHF